jgi:thymidylate synthase
MRFEPLYFGDRLHVVNPEGDVGLVVLWTPLAAATRRLEQLAPGLVSDAGSRVAVVANLYGDGLLAMFCNLLHNPQLRHLIAVGQDLGLPTCEEIQAFLDGGLETTQVLGATVHRIKGTSRTFPVLDGFDAERLRSSLTFRHFGKLSEPSLDRALGDYLAKLPQRPPGWTADRVVVELPMSIGSDYRFRPSHVAAHQVVRSSVLGCWNELVTRVVRFGRPVELANGPRLELLNAHTVITDPAEESAAVLAEAGYALEDLRTYQASMFAACLPEDVSYTYGNRLGGFFELVPTDPERPATRNTLAAVVAELRGDPESRRAYISLWDNTTDLPADGKPRASTPCLTTLFFRLSEGRLHLTTTYRAHNLLVAWVRNVYGLIAIQRYVAEAAGLSVGSISVISESLTIDPRNSRYETARQIADAWNTDENYDHERRSHSLREDPNGYFRVSVDAQEHELVAEHCFQGLVLKQYRGPTAAKIERQIIADMAVSLPSHALWLGRELMTKENALRALGHTGIAGRGGAPGD